MSQDEIAAATEAEAATATSPAPLPASEFLKSPVKVLITGSSGYVGHFLTDALLQLQAPEQYVVYGGTFGQGPGAVPTSQYPGRCEAVIIDGTDDLSVEKAVQGICPDVVVNLMAISAPAHCEKDPDKARKLNVPTALIASMKRYCPTALLVHLSTDMVYGANDAAPHWEEAKCRPVNVYGQTKLESEELVRQEWPHHVILRASAIYGPHPVGRACTKSSGGSFLQFVLSVLDKQKPEIFFREEVRSFVDIADVVGTILHFLQKHVRRGSDDGASTASSFGQTYNVGGAGAWTRLQFALTAAALLDRPSSCLVAMTRKECPHAWAHSVASPQNTGMDSSKLAQERGKACCGIEEGIRRYCIEPAAAKAGNNDTSNAGAVKS